MSLQVSKSTPVTENNGQKEPKNVENLEATNTSEASQPSENVGSGKRKQEGQGGAKRKKRSKISVPRDVNALTHLNEIKPGLKYIVESEEDISPGALFTVSVEVNNEKFIGKGPSKQLAKQNAAEAALKSFIQFRDMSKAYNSLSREMVKVDFTDDNFETKNTVFSRYQQHEGIIGIGGGDISLALQNKMSHKLRKVVTEAESKNPIVLLNELHPGLSYTLAKEDPTTIEQRFVMAVTVDGKVFEASGRSKKAAKAAVSQVVLAEKYRVTNQPPPSSG